MSEAPNHARAVAIGSAEPTDGRRRTAPLTLAVAIAILILCSAGSAQTRKAPVTAQAKPTTAAPATAKPGTGMLSGQGSGTLLQPKTSSGPSVAAPGLQMGADVERMSNAQFRGLPDAAMVRYRGQSMSKGAFIQQRFKEWGARSQHGGKPALSFEQIKAQFQQKQAATLEAQNARVQAVIDGFNQKLKQVQSSAHYTALTAEARALEQRHRSASPAEQSRLKTRALEIHEELTRIEQSIQ